MLPYQILMLQHFRQGEKALDGTPVDFNYYHFNTMQELDRLRTEIGSRCVLIRGNHGPTKETAVDCVFPDAPFAAVVMALFRSGCSKGLYQGGSIHLDQRMGPTGLARCWLAFKPDEYDFLFDRGFGGLKTYTNDGWDYYHWGSPQSWDLLNILVGMNS